MQKWKRQFYNQNVFFFYIRIPCCNHRLSIFKFLVLFFVSLLNYYFNFDLFNKKKKSGEVLQIKR